MPQTQGIHSLFEDKKILFVLKCFAVALLLVLAVPTMMFNCSICHDGIQGIVSGRFSSEYRFNVIYSGGAFDQGGLTKLAILIFAMELLTVLCYALSVLISRSRWWRVVCIAMVLVFFVAPVGMNLLYSWELARYIAVMGITPKRIEGALLYGFIFVRAYGLSCRMLDGHKVHKAHHLRRNRVHARGLCRVHDSQCRSTQINILPPASNDHLSIKNWKGCECRLKLARWTARLAGLSTLYVIQSFPPHIPRSDDRR